MLYKMSWTKVVTYLESCKEAAENQYAASAYTRVINQIKRAELKGRVTKASLEEIKLTEHMKEKILSFTTKPKSDKSSKTKHEKPDKPKKEKHEKPDKVNLKQQLSKITGIGAQKAKELIEMGLTDISQLEEDPYFESLSVVAKAFVTYKPIDRIERKIIADIEIMLKQNDRDGAIIFVGSYRRGAASSGDIDVLVPSLRDFHIHLVNLFGVKNVVLYSSGDDKANFLVNYKHWLQLDAFKYDQQNKYTMILYATGSKENNIRLRAIAKKQGMLLNQDGLYLNENGKSEKIRISSEADIYEHLHVPYQEPYER